MGREKKVSCVILNYNDADTTEKLVRRVYRCRSLNAVVIVDNHSADGSGKRLRKLAEELNPEKIVVLEAEKNGGYGAGNNLGIYYSYEVLQMDYVLIANPDVEFSESTVSRLVRLFETHPDLGVAAASMEDPVYGTQRNGWPLLGFWRHLAKSGPISRRLFRPFLEYGEEYFAGKSAVHVDVVHGSMLMVDALKMMECSGYDEAVFLYNEEDILGWRMLEHGYRTALLLTETYVHRHSESISKTYGDVWKRQKLRNQSAMYYYKKYLKINPLQELAARVFFQIVRFEIWFCSRVLGMKW
ncbi:MAG: glycosyltransferase family 2 protein [Lachnospiraceae bacterium]|nr:glycosyltransferase family 2 protein [Lachnospiraceae bacterium]